MDIQIPNFSFLKAQGIISFNQTQNRVFVYPFNSLVMVSGTFFFETTYIFKVGVLHPRFPHRKNLWPHLPHKTLSLTSGNKATDRITELVPTIAHGAHIEELSLYLVSYMWKSGYGSDGGVICRSWTQQCGSGVWYHHGWWYNPYLKTIRGY